MSEANLPSHRWYQKRFHVKLPRTDYSKTEIYDSGLRKIDAQAMRVFGHEAGGMTPDYANDFENSRHYVDGIETTLASAVTHTRASTATYTDSAGVLRTAAINEARIGHHVWNGSEWVNEGLLLESEARTNLYLDSETPETQVIPVTNGSTYTASFMAGDSVVDIDATIAATAVDVFVYDTSKDSDGGAWRTGALAQASG